LGSGTSGSGNSGSGSGNSGTGNGYRVFCPGLPGVIKQPNYTFSVPDKRLYTLLKGITVTPRFVRASSVSSSEVTTPTGATVVSTDRSSARLSPSPTNNSLQPIFEPWTASGPVERLQLSWGEHNMKHGRLAGAEDRKPATGRVGEEGRGRQPEEGWRQQRRSHRRHHPWGGAAITCPLPGRTGRGRHGCCRGSGGRRSVMEEGRRRPETSRASHGSRPSSRVHRREVAAVEASMGRGADGRRPPRLGTTVSW
jgi:hypothetical protein